MAPTLVHGIDELIETRQAAGLGRYDYWDHGEYVVVTGPSPEHGQLVVLLSVLLSPNVYDRGLAISAPVNIGQDKSNCRVPDLAVFHPDTRRTSPAFLTTALLVIEILSPGEEPQSKFSFYAAWNVSEYMEVDPTAHTVRAWAQATGTWSPIEHSAVLDIAIDDLTSAVRWPATP